MELKEIMALSRFAVLGDTLNPEKYAYKIKHALLEKGYTVYPVGKELASLNDMIRALILQEFDNNNAGLIMRHVSRLSITTEEPLPWSLDGEASPAVSQVEIENLHRQLLVQA